MDWDNDGKLDILSGCYWVQGEDGGFIQLLRGKSGLDFAEAEHVLDADGDPLLNREMVGEKVGGLYESQISTICTQQHAVDYDGDGDLDLVVGCFGSEFFLYLNDGSSQEAKLSKPTPLPVQSTSQHAAPHLADWDGDGDLDLLSGDASGGAMISINQGTRQKPEWSDFETLIEAPANPNGSDTHPGRASRVWATDWNGDGKLDLLLGDTNVTAKPKEDIDEADFDRRKAQNDMGMAELMKEAEPIQAKLIKLSEAGTEPPKKLNDQMKKLRERARKLSQEAAEFSDTKSSGGVWVYIRA